MNNPKSTPIFIPFISWATWCKNVFRAQLSLGGTRFPSLPATAPVLVPVPVRAAPAPLRRNP